MALQYSVSVQNARLDQVESTIGTSPVLQILTGSVPANCAAADGGTVLVQVALPSDWMNNASASSKTKLGSWTATASSTGIAAHWRIYNTGITTCHAQGTFGTSAADMIGDSTNFTSGQSFTVNTFTLNSGNQ